jgi:hypothetical protein
MNKLLRSCANCRAKDECICFNDLVDVIAKWSGFFTDLRILEIPPQNCKAYSPEEEGENIHLGTHNDEN